jgi:hypothetical protein
LAKIEARPNEAVNFSEDKPGALVIETKRLFNARLQFNGVAWIARRRVSYRRRRHLKTALRIYCT